jgi:hypothetical protein
MLPTKFWFFWPSGFRGEDFLKSANQKQELPMAAMFVNESELNEQSLRGSSKDASCQVSVHLAKRLHFVPISYQTWPPQTILVSDWLISKKSSPL